MISSTLQNALTASGFASRYYEICARHPLRSSPSEKCSNTELLAALSNHGKVLKLKGPGRVYEITTPRLLAALDFSFIIQGSGSNVEPCLGLTVDGIRSGTNYAVLAFSVNSEQKLPTPTPAYPRPYFNTLSELKEVVSEALELAVLVGSEVRRT